MTKKKCFVLITLIVIGLAYFVWIKLTQLAIPCFFRTITGWKCPGCGITTLFYSLLSGDVMGAVKANVFLMITIPFLLFEFIYECILGPQHKKWNDVLLAVYIIGLVCFGVIRNIWGF